jgi:predicted transcriptional regulator
MRIPDRRHHPAPKTWDFVADFAVTDHRKIVRAFLRVRCERAGVISRASEEPSMVDKDPVSIFDDEEDPETAARLDAEAEAAIAEGRVVSHERVVEWLKKLENGEREPPPKAR